jgi:hypothetical protein
MTNGNTAIEKVADVVETVGEETIDVADVTRSLAGREITFLTGGLAVGFGIGFGVGYLALKKKLQLKFEQLADEEITAMRQHYEAKLKNAEPKPIWKHSFRRRVMFLLRNRSLPFPSNRKMAGRSRTIRLGLSRISPGPI